MKLKAFSVKSARIEMVPLIDSFFLILVYFIIAFLSMSQHRGIPLDLPQAQTAIEEKIEHFGISVSQSGALFWNEKSVTLDGLYEELLYIKETLPPEKISIYIYGDEKAHHGVIIQVLDVVRKSGINRIFMETERETA